MYKSMIKREMIHRYIFTIVAFIFCFDQLGEKNASILMLVLSYFKNAKTSNLRKYLNTMIKYFNVYLKVIS